MRNPWAFPHAAQRLSASGDVAKLAGPALPTDALKRSLHLLKHRGPKPVLRWLRHLVRTLDPASQAQQDLASLQKREPFLQAQTFRAKGWRMVESANKLVVQARLKGSGMHWAACHVNPMVALRSAIGRDRWDDAWRIATARVQAPRRQRHRERIQRHLDRLHHQQQPIIADFLLAWMKDLLPRHCVPLSPPASPPAAKMVNARPTAHHPWKRNPACQPAKR